MPKLFANMPDDPRLQRQALVSKYSAARLNLLLAIVFSLVNIISLATNAGSYFLFSATVPYIIVDIAMLFCGRYPSEYYEEFGGMVFLDDSLFVASIVIAVLILAIYLLCWLFSKKDKVIWLKIALVLFGIDTVVLVLSAGLSALVDLGFHIWILYILYSGIKAHKTLKDMPKEEFIEGEFTELPADDAGEEVTESPEMIEAPEQAEEPIAEDASAEEETLVEEEVTVAEEPAQEEKPSENSEGDGFDAAKGPLDL